MLCVHPQKQTPADAPVCPPSSHHLIQGAKQPCPTPAKSIRLGNVAVCLDIETCACLSETGRLLLLLRSSVVRISMELVGFVSIDGHGYRSQGANDKARDHSAAGRRLVSARRGFACLESPEQSAPPPRLPSNRCNLACATSTASLMVARGPIVRPSPTSRETATTGRCGRYAVVDYIESRWARGSMATRSEALRGVWYMESGI